VAVADGRTADAIVDLRSVLRADPGRENAQLLLGKAHLQAGETGLAIEAFQQLVAAFPGNVEGRKDLAGLLSREQRWEEVRDLLAVGVQQKPDDLAMARMYVDALIRVEDWDAAAAEADRILALDPAKPLGHYVRGRVLQARGALEESIDAFQVALDSEPRAVETLTALVRSYVRLDDLDGALKYLQDFIAKYPDNPHGLTLLGEIHARRDDWAAATAANEKALEMQENWLPAYRNLIGIHLRQNDLAKAEAVVDRGLAIASDNNELLLLRANIREREQRYAEAIDLYEEVLRDNASLDIAANNYIALVADHRSDPASLAKARAYAERFEGTRNPVFQDTVGWLYYRLGEFATARSLLEQAVGRAGQLPQLRYHLGMTYYKLDQLDLARRELEAALESANTSFTGIEEARETLARL
jgi:tetratricopeptide (TPR) repeat protein